MRDPGDVSNGSRYEFPDAIIPLKATYDSLVIADAELTLDEIEKSGGKDKAIARGQELVTKLDSLYASVGSAGEWKQPGVQAEMLAAINNRKTKVQDKLRVLGGARAALTPKELLARYNGYVDNCVRYQQTETDCFAKIEATFANGSHPTNSEGIENATLLKQLRDMYAIWRTDYDNMAALAQENGFGKDNYWKFKPDTARFNRALVGAPGPASPPTMETQDKTKNKDKEKEVAHAPVDPVGESKKQNDAQRATQADAIRGVLNPAKNKAYGLGNRLFAAVQQTRKAAAIDAHNRGMDKLHTGDENAARLPKNPTLEDFEGWGSLAVQDYAAASACFQEGLALYGA